MFIVDSRDENETFEQFVKAYNKQLPSKATLYAALAFMTSKLALSPFVGL